MAALVEPFVVGVNGAFGVGAEQQLVYELLEGAWVEREPRKLVGAHRAGHLGGS